MKNNKMIARLFNYLATFFLSLILLLLFVIIIFRFAGNSLLNWYGKDNLINNISAIGVSVEDFSWTWSGWNLKLTAQNLSIAHPESGGSLFFASEIMLELDSLKSLVVWSPVVLRAQVADFEGWFDFRTSLDSDDAISLFLDITDDIQFIDIYGGKIHWVDDDWELTSKGLNIVFNRNLDKENLLAQLSYPGFSKEPWRLHGQWLGRKSFKPESGNLYFDLSSFDLSLLPNRIKSSLVESGYISFIGDVEFGRYTVQDFQLETVIDSLQRSNETEPLSVSAVWESYFKNNRWLFYANDFVLDVDGVNLYNDWMAFSFKGDFNDSTPFEVSFGNIDLESWSSDEFKSWFKTFVGEESLFNYSGVLHQPFLRWNKGLSYPEDVTVTLDFSELNLQSEDISFSSLSGRAEWLDSSLDLYFDSQNVIIDFPYLFNQSMTIDNILGHVGFNLEPYGWGLTLSPMQIGIENNNFDLQAAIVSKTNDTGNDIDLELFVNSKGISADLGLKWLPDAFMDQNLVGWLRNSIISGQAHDINLVFKGPASNFPFADNSGKFLVNFNTKDLVLSFLPDWPAITEINSNIKFINEGMKAEIYSGNSNGVSLRQAEVSIPSFSVDDNIRLLIAGDVFSDSEPAISYLNASPLWPMLSGVFNIVEVDGPLEVSLDLDVLLSSQGDEDIYTGKVILGNDSYSNTIKLVPLDITLTEAMGELSFVDSYIKVDDLSGLWGGSPISIDIIGQSDDLNDYLLNINTQGQLSNNSLFDYIPLTVWSSINGATSFFSDTKVRISSGDDYQVESSLTSDFVGMEWNLPNPLAKSASQSLPLRAMITGDGLTQEWRINSTLGRRARANLLLFNDSDDNYRWQGDVFLARTQSLFNSDEAQLFFNNRQQDKLNLMTILSEFDWQKWEPILISNQESPNQKSGMNADLNLHMLTDKFVFNNTISLDNAKLIIAKQDDSNIASIDSGGLTANVIIPNDFIKHQPGVANSIAKLFYQQKPLEINVEQVNITKFVSDSDFNSSVSSSSADNSVSIIPQQIPPFNLRISNLYTKDNSLGQLNASWRPHSVGGDLRDIDWRMSGNYLSGDLEWLNDGFGDITTFDAMLNSDDIGEFFKSLGTEMDIEDASASNEMVLTWDGPPWNMEWENTTGTISISLENGRITAEGVEPGIARLLNLLSVSSLSRRLRFDFSDVFQEGFAFDYFLGNISLDEGIAYTTDTVISGPAALLTVTGSLDFPNTTMDLKVYILPNISGSLPLALGIGLGNPALGALVFAVDTLVSSTVSELTRYEYTISGSWDEPDVDVEEVVISD